VVKEVLSATPDPWGKMVDVTIVIASRIMKRFRRPRVAVLLDDIFQAVGVENAEAYVKALLNLIEWPPAEYERVVVLVASSEGITRRRVGRHSWATIKVMWNMAKEGFRQLYDVLPSPKPPFDEVWRFVGGSPRYLERLYGYGWSADAVAREIARERGVKALVKRWGAYLEKAVEDPDYLWDKYPETEALINDLVEANLIVEVWDRKPHLWIDQPPPEKDPELGIGKYYAWQTPLHREAVKKALEAA